MSNDSDAILAARFLGGMDDLPTLSKSAQAVLDALSRPGESFKTVSTLVERDPVLAAMLLRAANSAFYPSPQRVSNLSLALARLGTTELRHLVMASALLDTFHAQRYGIDWERFWEHSFAAGIATKRLAEPGLEPAGAVSLGESPDFVAGLVHHLGILVEFLQDPVGFQRARVWSAQHGCSLYEGEREVFGFTHAELGAQLLELWCMPDDVIAAARFHHDPDAYLGRHKRAVHSVHLAALLCNDLGHGPSIEGVTPWFSERVFFGLGWKLEQIPEMKLRVAEAIVRGTQLSQALLAAAP